MIGRFLVAYVATLTDLVALVGDRVRPNQVPPSDSGDYVYYVQVDADRVRSFTGPSGLTKARLQVGIVSTDYVRMVRIGRLLAGTKGDERLDGYRGSSIGDIDVRACFLVDERDIVLPPQHGEGIGLFERQQDYELWFDEQAASVT